MVRGSEFHCLRLGVVGGTGTTPIPSCSFLVEACIAEDGNCTYRLTQLMVSHTILL